MNHSQKTIPFASKAGLQFLHETPVERVNLRALECAPAQIDGCSCGPAAIVAAVRSSRDLRATVDLDQVTLFDSAGEAICTRAQFLGQAPRSWFDGDVSFEITYAGMAIEEANRVLNVYFESSGLAYAANENLPDFRRALERCAKQPLLVNFLGSMIDVPVGGHFALIGAFHDALDLALVLDPARHKIGWYWVPVEALFRSMQVKRPRLQRPRGWIAASTPRSLARKD